MEWGVLPNRDVGMLREAVSAVPLLKSRLNFSIGQWKPGEPGRSGRLKPGEMEPGRDGTSLMLVATRGDSFAVFA
jgi:hypothetical protein